MKRGFDGWQELLVPNGANLPDRQKRPAFHTLVENSGHLPWLSYIEATMEDRMNSLGFAKSPGSTRVVVAMSGGVDSSVTAALLKEQGYDVIGITLQLYDHGAAVQRKGACCAGQDIHDARNVADAIGIPHYVLDYESRFQQAVIDDFADSYIRGETPLPCVRCNQTVKFADLTQTARELGADCLATGHYVQRVVVNGVPHLCSAIDKDRDQSYFLFATTDEQLDFLRFPLGSMPKPEVRAHAERFGLKVADKPDSQDICFVPNGRYADVIAKLRPQAAVPGEIVHLDGRVLGHHDGVIHYTIGQRKGLGVGGLKEPLFVVRIDAQQQRVVVGPREALLARTVYFKDVNWIGPDVGEAGLSVDVKIRSTGELIPARLFLNARRGGHAILSRAEAGVSPGQACVAYDRERVLGGGWIIGAETEKANEVA